MKVKRYSRFIDDGSIEEACFKIYNNATFSINTFAALICDSKGRILLNGRIIGLHTWNYDGYDLRILVFATEDEETYHKEVWYISFSRNE